MRRFLTLVGWLAVALGFALCALLWGLWWGSATHLAAAGPKPPMGAGPWVRLYTSDVTQTPLIAPAGQSVATVGLLNTVYPGEGHYRATVFADGAGLLSLSTGGSTRLPCTPCTFDGPAAPGQLSLTLSADAGGAGATLRAWQLSIGP